MFCLLERWSRPTQTATIRLSRVHAASTPPLSAKPEITIKTGTLRDHEVAAQSSATRLRGAKLARQCMPRQHPATATVTADATAAEPCPDEDIVGFFPHPRRRRTVSFDAIGTQDTAAGGALPSE